MKRGSVRIKGQGESQGVSLLGRWQGVFSFVLLQCACVCVPDLTCGSEPEHRTRSQLGENTDRHTHTGLEEHSTRQNTDQLWQQLGFTVGRLHKVKQEAVKV